MFTFEVKGLTCEALTSFFISSTQPGQQQFPQTTLSVHLRFILEASHLSEQEDSSPYRPAQAVALCAKTANVGVYCDWDTCQLRTGLRQVAHFKKALNAYQPIAAGLDSQWQAADSQPQGWGLTQHQISLAVEISFPEHKTICEFE